MTEAISIDGTSRALAPDAALAPDPALLEPCCGAGGDRVRTGAVVSTDLFYDGPEGEEQRWIAAGAIAVEMETATLLALASVRGLEAGVAAAGLRPAVRRPHADRAPRRCAPASTVSASSR